MYSTHHEGKSVVSERLIITLKNNIHKNMTPISKNVYINKLDDKVNIYSHILHSTTNTCNLFMKSQAQTLTWMKKIMKKVLNLRLVTM